MNKKIQFATVLGLFLSVYSAEAFTYTATFAGNKTVTTPSAGTTDYPWVIPTLNSANYGSFYDGGTNTIGGGNVSGKLYYYWDARVNDDWANGTNDYGAINTYRGATEVLGVGNNWGAWAYSKFGVGGDQDLRRPSDNNFLQMDNNFHRFLVEILFVPGGNDTARIWMDPNMNGPLSSWSTQANTVYTTTAVGDLSFNSVLSRTGSSNNLNSWTFSNLVLVVPEPGKTSILAMGFLFLLARRSRGHA